MLCQQSSQSYGFSSSHVWMWELDHKESWALKNGYFWAVVLEKTLESLLDCKQIKPVNPKGNQSWIFTGKTDDEAEAPTLATWWKELTHWKRSWCWEWLKAGGEGDDRGWDGWMASPSPWTWVWVNSGSWWWTVRPGVLQSMGRKDRRQLRDWTELSDISEESSWVGVHRGWLGDDEFSSLYLTLHTLKLLQCRTGQILPSSCVWYLLPLFNSEIHCEWS